MLNRLKISHKIYLISAIQLLFIAVVGLIGISQMQKIGNEIVDIAEDDIPLTRALNQLTEHQLQEAILFERALFEAALMETETPNAAENFKKLKTKIEALTEKINGEIIATEQFVEAAIVRLHSQEAKKEYALLLDNLKNIEKKYVTLSAAVKSTLHIATNKKIVDVVKSAHATEELQDDLDQELIDMLDKSQKFTLDAALQAEYDKKKGLQKIIIAFIVAIILSLIFPFIIGQSITKPIQALNIRLKEISEGDGDLTMRLDEKSKDETGEVARSFNRFTKKLRDTINDVNRSAKVLETSSKTAIDVMNKTVEDVQQQHTETEMVSHAMTEMSITIQSVAESTSNASAVAGNVKQLVDEGKTAACETQTIVTQLTDEMNNASSVIESLASETENIGSVLDAIRGIAEQTNLLALNAAIEAARAGDTGRGFAVVADEVRSLAQRTQASTGDIQQLVEGLQQEAGNAVETIKKGSSRTKTCLEKSADTAKAFADASEAVNEISDLNLQVAAAAEEQSVAAAQINESLINIKDIAETTSVGAEQTSLANKDIGKNLHELHANLNQFKIN